MLQEKIAEESKSRLNALNTALKAARVAVRDTKKAELLERTRRVKTKVWESVTEACASSGWAVEVQMPAEELAPGRSLSGKKKNKKKKRRKTKAQLEEEAYARGLLEGAKKASLADGGEWTRWGTQRDKYARNRVADGPKKCQCWDCFLLLPPPAPSTHSSCCCCLVATLYRDRRRRRNPQAKDPRCVVHLWRTRLEQALLCLCVC